MNWFSQSWFPTAIGAWSGPINTALMRVDPSSIPRAVRPSMMAWLVLVPMSLTFLASRKPGRDGTRTRPLHGSRLNDIVVPKQKRGGRSVRLLQLGRNTSGRRASDARSATASTQQR